MVSYKDFTKLDLKIAEITEVTPIAGSEKLVQLTISLGEEKRTLVAGIRKQYTPETLLGKQVVVLTNLEPRKLMGIESQGMLLCADTPEGPVLLQPEKAVASGSKIK